MERIKQNLLPLLKKYKYALLVLLVGVALMLLPGRSEKKESAAAVVCTPETGDEARQLEADLEALISQMEGAGEAMVLLTMEYGAEQLYQTDRRQMGDDTETTTVFARASGSEETPVARRLRYPVYQGAVVVCQGADRAAVRLQIVEAVSSLTGLGSDKIKVIKMKDQ